MSTRTTIIDAHAHRLFWCESDAGAAQATDHRATPEFLSVLCSGSRRSWAIEVPEGSNVPTEMELTAPSVTVSDPGVRARAFVFERSTMLCVFPRRARGAGALEVGATREQLARIDPGTRRVSLGPPVDVQMLDTPEWRRLQSEGQP